MADWKNTKRPDAPPRVGGPVQCSDEDWERAFSRSAKDGPWLASGRDQEEEVKGYRVRYHLNGSKRVMINIWIDGERYVGLYFGDDHKGAREKAEGIINAHSGS